MIEGGDTAVTLNPMHHDQLMNLSDAVLILVALSLAGILRRLDFEVNELLFARNSNNIFQKCDSLPLAEIVPKHLFQGEVEDVLSLLHVLKVMVQLAIVSSVQYYGDIILSEPNLKKVDKKDVGQYIQFNAFDALLQRLGEAFHGIFRGVSSTVTLNHERSASQGG